MYTCMTLIVKFEAVIFLFLNPEWGRGRGGVNDVNV